MITDPTNNGNCSLLDAALGYLARGLCIIPTKMKKAAVSWKNYQTTRPDEAELQKLFGRKGITGLAVVLGSASGGLVCRDFDNLDKYKEWAAKHPELATSLPTVETARGRHVYFRGPEGFQNFGDGEYRGTPRQYCLLPPSRHPEGHIYRWLNSLPSADLPTIDPYLGGLWSNGTERTEENRGEQRRTEEVGGVERGDTPPPPSSPSSLFQVDIEDSQRGKLRQAIEDAITATQPQAHGQRHRCVFELCRKLKAIDARANADTPVLRQIVEEWHKRARPVIGTKPFTDTWGDFLQGWGKVKYPAGKGRIEEAFQRAVNTKPPAKAVALYPDEQEIPLLASLCRELQRNAGDAEFYLDCRNAGKLLQVTHKKAWNWLNILCSDGILKAGEKGSHAEHKASRFRYVAD